MEVEVANPPAAVTSALNDVTLLASAGGKRLLQGRALPAILLDQHPGSSSRLPNGFRPQHTRHAARKVKDGSEGQGRKSGGGAEALGPGVSLPGENGGGGGGGGEEHLSTTDHGRLLFQPEGDWPSRSLKASSKSDPKTTITTTTAATSGVVTTSVTSSRKKKKRTRHVRPSAAAGVASGRDSSTSSGVSSGGRTSVQTVRELQARAGRSGGLMEGQYPYSVNPDPAPFMPANFMRYHGLMPFGYPRSSTVLKKISIPKRHQDAFGDGSDADQRGFMLHTDRYQYEALKALESLSQKDRLLAEMAYLDYLRGIKRRRDVVPHRAHLDLFLGGKKIECEERFDLNREIQRLKAMAMPVRARDLYHGRGIKLPPSHHSLVPRAPRQAGDSESDEDDTVRVSAPASVQRSSHHAFPFDLGLPGYERQISLTLGEAPHTRAYIRGKRYNQLPSLLPPSKSQTPRPGMHREDTINASRMPSNAPQSSRSSAWADDQNKLSQRSKKQLEEERTFLTGQQYRAPLLPQSGVSDKRLTPEPPPPTTEGGVRRRLSPQKPRAPLKEASEDQVNSLRQTFQRLDTDKDGHLQFDQLRSQLPAELPQQQESFLKQVYEITRSSGALFGVDDFMKMKQLTERVTSISGPAKDAYSKIDFDSLESAIVRYVDLFQKCDTGQKGKISTNSLKELIGLSQNKPPLDENSSAWNVITESLQLDYSSEVSWTEYLAHIPLFLTLTPYPASQPE